MKRRSFFKVSWGASISAFLANRFVSAANMPPGEDQLQAIKKNMIRHRNNNRSTVVCRHGIVCTSQPLASMAGVDILKAGGNAVDATIAANAALGVVEPMSCGMGGDLFAILWIEKDKKLYGLNASGRSPYQWSIKEAEKRGLKEIPVYGPLSWSVPGCVSG